MGCNIQEFIGAEINQEYDGAFSDSALGIMHNPQCHNRLCLALARGVETSAAQISVFSNNEARIVAAPVL